MANNEYPIDYTYRLTDGTTEQAVYPLLTEGSFSGKRDDRLILEEDFQGTFVFFRNDYDFILAANFDDKFTLYVDRREEDGTVTTDWAIFTFLKTEVEFDDDNSQAIISPAWERPQNSILDNLDKEFDLEQLGIRRVSVTVTQNVLMQFYFPGSSYMLNFQSGNWWETSVTQQPERNPQDPLDFWFQTMGFANYNYGMYIPQDPSLIPSDVSGRYQIEAGGDIFGPWINDNGLYRIVYQPQTSPESYIIERVSDQVVLFFGEDDNGTYNTTDNRHTGIWITMTDQTASGSPDLNLFRIQGWIRIISASSIYDVYINAPLPAEDSASNLFGNFGYSFYLVGSTISALISGGWNIEIFPEDTFSATPTAFDRVDSQAAFGAGEYFTEPTGYSDWLLPFAPAEWEGLSLWIAMNASTLDIFETGGQEITLRRCYILGDVISALLAQINPDITHDLDTDHSDFLYAALNPITGVATKEIIITQKSNLTSGEFERPATRALIKLSAILDMLWFTQRLVWWIDSSDRFRIEHWKYAVTGGDYSTAQIAADITTVSDSKNGEVIETGQKKIKFNGDLEYKSIQTRWMDSVSFAFEGYAIEDIVTGKQERVSPSEEACALFTSDVDFMLANPTLISRDGFALFACAPIIALDTYETTQEQITVNTNDTYSLQNLYFSPFYFHRFFLSYAWLAAQIRVNNETETPDSKSLIRLQEVSLPYISTFDILKLITSSYGNGFISEYQKEFYTEYFDLKLSHEPS